MLTCDPVTKGKTGVAGTESVTQHLLLEIDDWLKHCLVLDLSGGDDNAAVHEVSDGVGQIFFSLGQKSLQTKDLREQIAFYSPAPNKKGKFFVSPTTLSSLSHPVSHQSTHGTAAFTVVYPALAGADKHKDKANRDGRLQRGVHHHGIT